MVRTAMPLGAWDGQDFRRLRRGLNFLLWDREEQQDVCESVFHT